MKIRLRSTCFWWQSCGLKRNLERLLILLYFNGKLTPDTAFLALFKSRSNGFWDLLRITFFTPIHRDADGQVV